MDKIEVKEVTKRYLDSQGDYFEALKGVSFDWPQTENLAIIGESGSGKSTLARLLIGIEKPTTGRLLMDGEDSRMWKFRRWRKARRHLQAVFQDASGTMDPAYSIYHNVEEALKNLSDLNRKEREERILQLMQRINLDRKLLSVPVGQLSGGEQRRLSLLRALSLHPDYVVLDEVTSGLDLLSANAVMTLLEKYHHEYGCAYLLITHDKQAAYRLCDRILEMEKGEIVGIATKQ